MSQVGNHRPGCSAAVGSKGAGNVISCADARKVIADILSPEGVVSLEDRKSLRRHLLGCQKCSKALESDIANRKVDETIERLAAELRE